MQNDEPVRDIGVATATATFFRSVGGSMGIAIFGAIFACRLASGLAAARRRRRALLRRHQHPARGGQALPPEVRHDFLLAFVHALQPVFLVGAALAAVTFVLALLLEEVPLRDAVRSR